MNKVLVAGGGGFIGGHLVKALTREGIEVRAVDAKPASQWHTRSHLAENLTIDLSQETGALEAVDGCDYVYNLAADMGGMGFIQNNKALCMLSVLINTHLLKAARHHDVRRYFFASSACVYAAEHQSDPNVKALKESDAYPANPEDGYGWEKLFSERMCRHFSEDFQVPTRVARYHNVYGPHGTFSGGREKAPAAICRKVAIAKMTGERSIEIWGDGEQTRSFMYIDDCVYGTRTLMGSDYGQPINIGSHELVTINGLVSAVEAIAGVRLERRYLRDAPQGVRGRNSDNELIKRVLDWEPMTPLAVGLERTYAWIWDRLVRGR